MYSLKVDGNKNIRENFKIREFACNDGSDQIVIHAEFVAKVQQIRTHFGKSLVINSAYRTRTHNEKRGRCV